MLRDDAVSCGSSEDAAQPARHPGRPGIEGTLPPEHGEGADAPAFSRPGWATQSPPTANRERGSDDKGHDDEEAERQYGRNADQHRQFLSSQDIDDASSTYSKKGSNSSSGHGHVKSDARHKRSPFTDKALAQDALHIPEIPGVPEHDTCPSVWPAFLAPKREKNEKIEKTSLGSLGSLSSGSKKEPREAQGPRARDPKNGKNDRNDRNDRNQKSNRRQDVHEPDGTRRPHKSQAPEDDANEAVFEAAAVAARQAAEEAAQAAKAAELREQVAAQREAQLKDLEHQLSAAKKRNKELEAAADLAARREEDLHQAKEELAVQAAEMRDLTTQLSSTKQRNVELEAAAKAMKDQQASAQEHAERAREIAEAAATAAWAAARQPQGAKEAVGVAGCAVQCRDTARTCCNMFVLVAVLF